MAKILDGKQVANAITESLGDQIVALAAKKIKPALAIIRIGKRGEDISYEKGATKRCESAGIEVRRFTLREDAQQQELLDVINRVNNDASIHGCLMLRPFPKHIDDALVRNALAPEKDVDGVTDASLTGLFTGIEAGFPPCTPKACIEILDYYGVDIAGKNVAVIGRSLVVGKPVAMMLLKRDATVTICHTKTADMPKICSEADILILAAGKAEAIGKEFVKSGQIIIDVGINVNREGKLCGDLNFGEAEPIAGAITPVPGGVGSVTTSVLAKHVTEAATGHDIRLPQQPKNS